MNTRENPPFFPIRLRSLRNGWLLRRFLFSVFVLVVALCPGWSTTAMAMESEATPPSQPQPQVEQEEDDPQVENLEGDASQPPSSREDDPCAVSAPGDEPRLDQWRREIFETVCESAATFDGFFGSRRFDEEARRTHGRAGVRVIWDEHHGFELDGTLKVRVNLPNLDHRLNAFVGREERDDYLTGAEADLDFLPTFFGREGGEEWLLGLGYRPISGAQSSLDFDAGVDVDSTLDPFVRSRYRRYWLVGEGTLLRARQSFYWTNQKQFGSGTRVDLERAIGERTLARWSGNVAIDDETEGEAWDTGVTFYHGLSPDRAISWFAGIEGETGREVPIVDYGTRVTYRQRMFRDWFFGEVLTGVTWPRDNLQEQRELAFHVGFGFEIQFSGEDLGIRGKGRDVAASPR